MKTNGKALVRSSFALAMLSVSISLFADDSNNPDTNEIEEIIIVKDQSNVRYSHTVNSVEMFATPVDVLKPVSSLAFDNSIGQIRSRGSEANHIGIHIDGYDVADPVSDFNFATISCAGINSLHFSATPGSGSIGGLINLESDKDARRRINLAIGSAGSQAQFDYGHDHHNFSISRKQWEGIDIRSDGDLDGIEHLVGHYHFNGSNWNTTIRFGTVEQGYDRGRAEIDQGLVGVTGTLWNQMTVRLSNSFNRATWYESFNNNTNGSRTKLSLSVPIGKLFTWELDQVYDINKSEVRGEPTRKPIAVNYLRAKYEQSYRNVSWHTALTRIDSSQDEALLSKSVHMDWRTRDLWNTNSGLVIYFEYDHQTVAFPSMIDRYGWGQKWLPNPNVKPERGTGVSVGAKYITPTTNLQVTRFTARLRDKISFGFNVSENIDYGRNRGIELLWQQTWMPQFTSKLAFSRVNSEARIGLDQPYRETERRPTNVLTGTFSYSASKLNSVVTLRWVDEAVDACWRGCETLDAYLVVDGSITYTWFDTVEVSANVYNLFDETYYQVLGYNTPGQQFSVGFSWLLGS